MRNALIVAFALAAMSLAGAPGLRAADDNPLLGNWRYSGKGFVDSQGHDWCDLEGEWRFGRNDQTRMIAAGPDRPETKSTSPAYYAVYGNTIFVSSAEGVVGSPFTMLDHDHMEDDKIGHCIYERK